VQPPIDPAGYLAASDPVAALGEAWVRSVGERLDLWVDSDYGGGRDESAR
jgi:hypothetical protein